MSARTDEAKGFLKKTGKRSIFPPGGTKTKIDFYLKNEELRKEIAEAGYKRLSNSSYSYIDRAKKLLRFMKVFRNNPS